MTTRFTLTPSITRRRFQLGAIALASTLAVACGGGGSGVSVGGASVGAQSVTASGTISGFGSVIANGVEYALDGTVIVDDSNDTTITCSDNVNNCGMQMGMEVDIESGDITPATTANGLPTATAKSIHIGSSLRGPVDSISTDTLVVLGQTVSLTTSTRFEGGIPVAGDVVEVYGLLDKSVTPAQVSATLVQKKTGAVNSYRLRGLFTRDPVNANLGTVGGQSISFANLSGEQLTQYLALTDGQQVRVKLDPTAVNGVWTALSIKSSEHKLSPKSEGQHNELEGFVETINTVTVEGPTPTISVTSFVLDGVTVTLPADVRLEGGTLDLLAVGARLEIEGTVNASGELVPTKIEFKKAKKRSERHGSNDGAVTDKVRFKGVLSNVTATTFEVRGQTFDYSDIGAVSFDSGAASDIADGARVEVKGYLMADGVTYKLIEIEVYAAVAVTPPAPGASSPDAPASAAPLSLVRPGGQR